MPHRDGVRIVAVVGAVVWAGLAVLAATHQWAELQKSPKELTWFEAFRWQGLSWLLLVPLTPLVYVWVRARPVGRRDPRGLWMHAGASVVFGVAFLFASVPLRLSAHPSAARWSFFGEAIYKSIPAFALLGICLYWLLILVASLLETRSRLYARIDQSGETGTALSDPDMDPAASSNDSSAGRLIAFSTRSGTTRVRPSEIRWIEPAPAGARMNTDSGEVLVRHTLAQLEVLLPGGRFVRTHRGVLVNLDRVRELVGSPSRDGTAVLDSGEAVPVSRRRHPAIAELVGGSPSAPKGAPVSGECVPLSAKSDTKGT